MPAGNGASAAERLYLAAVVAPYVKPGAAIIGTGAGSITSWMNNLPQILAKKLEGLA